MALAAIAADVAAGGTTLLLEGSGQGLQAHDQVLHHVAVLLGETGKHLSASGMATILRFSSDFGRPSQDADGNRRIQAETRQTHQARKGPQASSQPIPQLCGGYPGCP